MEDDYFGEVTVPQDEEEEDATNDTTFGDIGDIRAGDEASDALWKPSHQSLSSKIEVEKELFQHQQGLGAANPLQSPKNVVEGPAVLLSNPFRTGPTDSWWNMSSSQPNGASVPSMPSAASPLSSMMSAQMAAPPISLSGPLDSAGASPAAQTRSVLPSALQPPTGQTPSIPVPNLPNSSSGLPQKPLLPPFSMLGQKPIGSPRHPQAQLSQQHLLQQRRLQMKQSGQMPPQMSPLQSMSQPKAPPKSQQSQISQQGTGRSMPTSYLQQAQQQAQQQRMSPQDYERTMMAYYENHTRELLQRHKETAGRQLQEAEAAQRAGVLFDRNKFNEHQNAVRQRILTDHYARVNQLRFVVWRQSQQQQHLMQLAKTAQEQGMPVPAGVQVPEMSQKPAAPRMEERAARTISAEAEARSTELFSSSTRSHIYERPGRDQGLRKPEPDRRPVKANGNMKKAPRLLEIERQMAAAGLGPSKPKSSRETFDVTLPRLEPRPEPRSSRKKGRRLESMTEKDQELVFRVHLRQVESAVVYTDDYYNAMLKKKERMGNRELFPELAEKVHAIRLRSRQRGGEGRPIRTRRSKNTTGQNGDVVSASRSDHNMKALATALGTVQSWNPRAPRRVMDFAVLEKGTTGKEGPQKLLRDEERVKVRQEIEKGYDIIATIHDVARGESVDSLEAAMKSLLGTLHVEENVDVVDRKEETESKNKFFTAMCTIEKGRRYLAHVIELLDVGERVMLFPAIMENLGKIVFAVRRQSFGKEGMQCELMNALVRTIQDSDVLAVDCVAMFQAFASVHNTRHDLFLSTFRSSSGSKVMFLCMQRISRGIFKKEIEAEEMSKGHMEKFFEVFTDSLQEIFEGAESVSKVWEVVAIMDALTVGEHKIRYRAELNKLLRSGVAPPPPVTKSAQ